MTVEKMNVHKALCELKTLEDRISKEIDDAIFVCANKHSNTKINGRSIQEYSDETRSVYQSITGLMRRRDALKRAVVLSNASAKVTIGGKEYTVAEAIEMKNHGIPLMRRLCTQLDICNRSAQEEANRNNGDRLELRADEYIKSLYGNTDLKNAGDEIRKVRADFIAAQTYEIIDPIKVQDEIKKLSDEISAFLVDVDSALSVSNAMTEITSEY